MELEPELEEQPETVAETAEGLAQEEMSQEELVDGDNQSETHEESHEEGDEVEGEEQEDHATLEDEEQEEEQREEKKLRIFISYNRNETDKTVADRIYDELGKRYHVFLDYRTIKPGDPFELVTQEWLDSADFIIALISERSIETSFIKAELLSAYNRYKNQARPTVIPLRVNYAGPSGLTLDAYIGQFQAIFWDNQNYLWLFEQLQAGLSNKLPAISKPVITGADIIPIGDTLRARYAETFVEPRDFVNKTVSFEEKRLLWITGDAAVRNYVALSLAATIKDKSVYEITKQRKWSEINNTFISDSTIVLRDALPAPYLNESGAIGEWHSLRAIIERNNIIIATSSDEEFERLEHELLKYQFTDYQHRHVGNDSYTDESKLAIFNRLIDHLFKTGEIDDDKYAWVSDLARDPNEPVTVADGQGRTRALERRRRDMRRKFRENIGRWSPADLERFVLSLSRVGSESDIARLLQRTAAIEDEIRSWFLSLDDSTKCFVMTVALFTNLDHEDLWGRYKTIVEHLRQFDASLRLLPFGICRKRAHPYVSLDGRIELDERVADEIRQEIARSYREYFIELTPRLKDWSVPSRNPKTIEQRNQRKPQIEETKEARLSIARMVGIVARLGLDDLVDILDYWATDSNIQIRKSVAFAFEQTARSPTGVNYALNLMEKWCLDINSNGQFRWRALAAAHALGYVTAAANDAYVTARALNCLRPDARFYASIALREVARYASLSSTEGALGRLAKDDRIEVRVNVAAALNEARAYDAQASDALIDRWVLSDDPNRRWVALCGIVTSRRSQNGAGPTKYERLLGFLDNKESASSLASVLGETVTDDHYGQVARDTFSYLVRETKEQAWNNLAAGLGAVPIGKLEKGLLPLLHFDTPPLFNERAIEVRREVLKTKLDDPPHFLSILKAWLSREQVRLEVFRALTMLLDESPDSDRLQFIAAMAEYYAHNPSGVNQMLTTLEAMAPARFASISRAVSREAFRLLLQDPTRFLTLCQKQLADQVSSAATVDAIDALASDDPPGSREQLLRALLDGYAREPEAARNLLSTLRSTGSNLPSVAHEFNYRLIEGAMSTPAELPSLVLDLVHRDIETFSLLNYLAAPEPQGQRSKLVRALVEARLLEIDAADEFLALPALKEWLNLASIAGEVARSFYVRRIFSRKFVRRLFVRKS